MIPFLNGIRRAIYNLNKRIDLLEQNGGSGGGMSSSEVIEIRNKIETLESLISEGSNPTTAIDKFNEIVAFLQSIENTDTLSGMLSDIAGQIPTNISDLNNDAGYVTQQNVVANEAFPSNWPKNGNMSGLINAINQDDSATQGKIYLATVSYDDLPTGLMQAEMKVEITVGGSGSKVILFTITSENVAPYHWEYTSAYGRSGHWRSFLTSHQDISGKQDVIDSSHKLSSDLVDDTNKTHKFVTAEEKQTWNNKANIWSGTQAEYDLLTPDPNTIYVITPAPL